MTSNLNLSECEFVSYDSETKTLTLKKKQKPQIIKGEFVVTENSKGKSK